MRHSAVGDRPEPAVAGRPSGRRRWLVVTAVMLFAVGSLLLLEATNAGEGRDPAGQPESAADLGHIHGIGVNPADGGVYVGTHRGVFQLSEGQLPVLVSDRVQDFMGFTVVGPDHFLAGGHPGDEVIGVRRFDRVHRCRGDVDVTVAGWPGGLPLAAGPARFRLWLRLRPPDR